MNDEEEIFDYLRYGKCIHCGQCNNIGIEDNICPLTRDFICNCCDDCYKGCRDEYINEFLL